MDKRIEVLTKLTLDGKMYPDITDIEFDRNDIFLSKPKMTVKRLHDFVMAQTPKLTDYQAVPSTIALSKIEIGSPYHNHQFENITKLLHTFYSKPIDNLSTFEWQHATADYKKVIAMGISGLLDMIDESKSQYSDNAEKTEFLECLESAAHTLIDWSHIYSEAALRLARTTENEDYKANLTKLSKTLKKVPEKPAESFYEAIVSLCIVFGYARDSLGTLDRTLYPYYKKDIDSGLITRDEAKLLLQELFLVQQANTPKSGNFTRGGESHFCVGGYDEQGEDIFNDFSMLILESLTELPTFIPQVSLRWTKKLPFETFLKVLDMCVKDDNKRIAFISDEIKMKAAMNIAKIPYDVACNYSSVGCNEVAYPGGFVAGTTNTNILRSVENTLYNHEKELLAADIWEKFWEIYKSELLSEIDIMLHYEDEFMRVRSRDTSYTTSLLFTDCIKTGKSFTQGACTHAIGGAALIGITNVIDSLSVIKQFIYDEKITDMQTMLNALKKNWEGYEELHAIILKKGKFFGNDDDTSNYISKLFTDTLYEYTKDKKSLHGYHLLFGNLQGYQPHHKWFGEKTKATPDGRYGGDMIKFGIGQSGAYDREGLSALLNSVAKCDKHGIMTGGASVTNINLDEQLIKNPDNFPKTAKMLETYFQNGGSQFQLNFVSQEDLKKAQITPEQYRNLRVRVSGFSDFFVNLNEPIQNDIIKRTVESH